MTIGENLRQLRLQKGLTQEQAAAKLHITRQALSSYESQRTQPDIHMLLALSEVYETDLDGILYGQETSLKNLRRLRTLALWLLALLTGLSILSAALLWSANAFFPLTGGQLEQMPNQRKIEWVKSCPIQNSKWLCRITFVQLLGSTSQTPFSP